MIPVGPTSIYLPTSQKAESVPIPSSHLNHRLRNRDHSSRLTNEDFCLLAVATLPSRVVTAGQEHLVPSQESGVQIAKVDFLQFRIGLDLRWCHQAWMFLNFLSALPFLISAPHV